MSDVKTVNAYCKNLGWLFEDLKRTLAGAGAFVTNEPDESADAWVCIRSREWKSSPDLRRTTVQIHDIHLKPKPNCLNSAGCVQFTHPFQLSLWQANGFKGNHTITPIGSRDCIKPSTCKPERPTIGFFCRENKAMSKGSLLFRDAVLLAKKLSDFDVLLIGDRLSHIAEIGKYQKRAANPDDYSRIDALVSTSTSPCVPLSVYEACAAGISVISTPRQFPGHSWPMVMWATNAEEIANCIVQIVSARPKHNSVKPYVLETWAETTLQIARKLCENEQLVP